MPMHNNCLMIILIHIEITKDATAGFPEQFLTDQTQTWSEQIDNAIMITRNKCLAPSIAPYISLGYNGTIGGLLTLAHELGHGIHYRLASNQSYLNFRLPPVLAETVSTFIEAALTAYLIDHKVFGEHGSALLASRIEGILWWTGLSRPFSPLF